MHLSHNIICYACMVIARSILTFMSDLQDIYFLSFERSLIVSVYACMHCVWEMVVCCHSGDAGLCVYVVCTDNLAQLVGIYDALSSSHSLGDSYS